MFFSRALRDQDFRAVFVVTCAQSSRRVFARHQTKAETISSRFVLRRVVLEIFPEMIGERVFLRHIVFKDGFELRPFRREFREFKPASFLEADKEDTFAV